MNTVTTGPEARVTRRARRRPGVVERRFGYLVALGVNLLLLFLINRSPGWQVVPFLTDQTPLVLGLVNASLWAGIVTNILYAVHDPRWFRAVGGLVTTAVGFAALVRSWQVFPLDFGVSSVPWDTLARWAIAVGIVGSAIAIVVQLITFLAGVGRDSQVA